MLVDTESNKFIIRAPVKSGSSMLFEVSALNKLYHLSIPLYLGFPTLALLPFVVVVVQSVSPVRLFVTPWTAACQAALSFIISQSLLKFISIELVMLSNHLILCHPILLLPSIFPSIRIFPNELTLCTRWQKYWSFSFSISPSNKYCHDLRITYCFYSVAKLCTTLCDPMDCSTPGFPVFHCLLEFTQTPIH